MVRWLNKAAYLLLLLANSVYSQEGVGDPRPNTKEYKDPKQHENFRKREIQVANWQINQLKSGALVVRLKQNKLVIDALRAAGKNDLAREKEFQTIAINKNTMFAYKENFRFCKVYFIYSNISDTLLHGARAGVFLDTNLMIDPAIEMKETFYLLAEKDYGYNSSLGFIPEDSASKYFETGSATRLMTVVLKNKYGHQLKKPFPYFVIEKNSPQNFSFPICVSGENTGQPSVYFYVNRTFLRDLAVKDNRAKTVPVCVSGSHMVTLNRQETYEKISQAVQELSGLLMQFYKKNPPLEQSQIPSDIRPFLY